MSDSSQDPIRELWNTRYRDACPDAQLAGNETVLSLLAHRSIRSYLAEEVPENVLAAALAAAQSASTSSNLQMWSVIAIADPARKARLAALSGGQKHIEQAPLFLAWVLDQSRLRRLGEAQGKPTEGLDYLETFVVGAVDTTLAAQNAAVAFESFGLGIVYIGGMRNHPEQVAAELALPPGSMVLFGMCVGYPDQAHLTGIKPRLPLAAVLHRERYDSGKEAGLIADYDRRVADYLRERGANGDHWSATVVDRVGGPQSLGGRDRLREALAERAFKLR
ncbi:NADPH-dependent oxidoreductase [Paludibacterium yongneupense]|uniref:NADPH-dependent oxidoreductase n=1 Tax=Paludibacterium yongneupense TaxID=400061 RepID=UPI000406799D|nr:NADPH-dependent oxidoreductase [Paludibacterium yongneupense]